MKSMGKFTRLIGAAVILCVIGTGIWLFLTYFEGKEPRISAAGIHPFLGLHSDISVDVSDAGRGLRTVTIVISQEGTDHVLQALAFPRQGVYHESVRLPVEPRAHDLKDGTATLTVTAVDYSFRKNESRETIPVTIDTEAPRIMPVTSSHYINRGGTCIALYRLSEDVVSTGVKVNDRHFRGYPVTINDRSCYICYFAYPLTDEVKGATISIDAADAAGNSSSEFIPFHIRNKKFRADDMRISTSFLKRKMPEFQERFNLQGDYLETFNYVNSTMRAENLERIRELCSNPEPQQLWEGTFVRMRNAATMARFGDRRTYYLEGKQIGASIHMGVDLASTKNAAVAASNNGKVIYSDYLGIYGNTVILDHGLGLFSFYAHLTSFGVTRGQEIKKGDIIGRSGLSGLAGGDHLHFSMIVGDTLVNPVEWWDPHWIKDNVTRKMTLKTE